MSSSRTDFFSAPDAGTYVPKAVPPETDELSTYINDELLSLGGRLNNVLEGGAFPPQSELPRRFRDGMMIYFTQAIANSEVDRAGVWLYRNGKWWKLFDDPSEVGTTSYTVYALTADETQPGTPTTSPALPPIGSEPTTPTQWFLEPPTKNNKGDFIWASILTNGDDIGENGDLEWSEPVIWSAGVIDGGDPIHPIIQLTRYIAYGTVAPHIEDRRADEPETLDGTWTSFIPPVEEGKRFIWVTKALADQITGEVQNEWDLPERYATPQTIKYDSAYGLGTKLNPPTWEQFPIDEGLPGPAWSYEPPVPANADQYVWTSARQTWINFDDPTSPGEPMSGQGWAQPVRFSGISADRRETRYLNYGDVAPVITNESKSEREPVTVGEVWTSSIPPVDLDNDRPFIWTTSATVTADGEVIPGFEWADPTKYATPNTQTTGTAYYLGPKSPTPGYDPDGVADPSTDGYDWVRNVVPEPSNSDEYIWASTRIEWLGGTGAAQWSFPQRNSGINPDSEQFRYFASTNTPAIDTGKESDPNPTTGGVEWDKSVPSADPAAGKVFIWSINATFTADGRVVGTWSDPAKFATPQTQKTTTAYALGDKTAPTPGHSPTGDPLPAASGWFYDAPEPTSEDEFVWTSSRNEWVGDDPLLPGSAAGLWSNPVRGTGLSADDIKYRYVASGDKPLIDPLSDEEPMTPGLTWTANIPAADPAGGKPFIWATQATFSAGGVKLSGWDDAVKYATPQTVTTETVYAEGSTESQDPDFTAGRDVLPAATGWDYVVPSVSGDKYVWSTTRQIWDGFPQGTAGIGVSPWSNPLRASGASADITEVRYYASTEEPVFDDADGNGRSSSRIPKTNLNDWELSIPPTDSSNSFIWSTTAIFTAGGVHNTTGWTKPVKYATPDTTLIKRLWATGTDWNAYPTPFDDTATPPHPDFSETQPTDQQDNPIWLTERLEWAGGGAPATARWSIPVRWNAQKGESIEGDRWETWYKESPVRPTGEPTGYPPQEAGWSPQPTNIQGYDIWASTAKITPDGEIADGSDWSIPVKWNGEPGEGIQWKGLATVAELNAMDPAGHAAGDSYIIEGVSGTLIHGNVAVVVDDRVIWNHTNQQWDNLGPTKGEEGPEGQRGTITTVAETLIDFPTDAQFRDITWDAIVGVVADLNPSIPIPWDVVTINHETPIEPDPSADPVIVGNFKTRTVRVVSGLTKETLVIDDVALVVDGDAVVTGTLHGNKIISQTIRTEQLASDTITGREINALEKFQIGGGALGTSDDVIILDGDPLSDTRIWIGDQTQADANFSVDKFGNASLNNGHFSGNITSTATITGSDLRGGQLSIGALSNTGSGTDAFSVDTSGNVIAESVILRKDLQIIGDGTATSDYIVFGNALDPDFKVDKTGTAYAKGMSLSGGTLQAGQIQGAGIGIGWDPQVGDPVDPPDPDENTDPVLGKWNFAVNSGGRVHAKSAVFEQDIEIIGDGLATTDYFKVGVDENDPSKPLMRVDGAGQLFATGGFFGGGTVSAGNIHGSAIMIGWDGAGGEPDPGTGTPSDDWHFSADSSGNVVAKSIKLMHDVEIITDGTSPTADAIKIGTYDSGLNRHPFHVSASGNVTASNIFIPGGQVQAGHIQGSSLLIGWNPANGTDPEPILSDETTPTAPTETDKKDWQFLALESGDVFARSIELRDTVSIVTDGSAHGKGPNHAVLQIGALDEEQQRFPFEVNAAGQVRATDAFLSGSLGAIDMTASGVITGGTIQTSEPGSGKLRTVMTDAEGLAPFAIYDGSGTALMDFDNSPEDGGYFLNANMGAQTVGFTALKEGVIDRIAQSLLTLPNEEDVDGGQLTLRDTPTIDIDGSVELVDADRGNANSWVTSEAIIYGAASVHYQFMLFPNGKQGLTITFERSVNGGVDWTPIESKSVTLENTSFSATLPYNNTIDLPNVRVLEPTTGQTTQFRVRLTQSAQDQDAFNATYRVVALSASQAGQNGGVFVSPFWDDIRNKPTTVAGYGIDGDSPTWTGNHTWSGSQRYNGHHYWDTAARYIYGPNGGAAFGWTTATNMIIGNSTVDTVLRGRGTNGDIFVSGSGATNSPSYKVVHEAGGTWAGTHTWSGGISKSGLLHGTANLTGYHYPTSYVFNTTTNPRDWDEGVSCNFVRVEGGYPSFGAALRVATYGINDGGAFEIYAPYNSTYGGDHLRYRVGLYNNAGASGFRTIMDDGGGTWGGTHTWSGTNNFTGALQKSGNDVIHTGGGTWTGNHTWSSASTKGSFKFGAEGTIYSTAIGNAWFGLNSTNQLIGIHSNKPRYYNGSYNDLVHAGGGTWGGNHTWSGKTTISVPVNEVMELNTSTLNGGGCDIKFSDLATTQTQNGHFGYWHQNASSNGHGDSFKFRSTEGDLAIILESTGYYYVGDKKVVDERGGTWAGTHTWSGTNTFSQTVTSTSAFKVDGGGDNVVTMHNDGIVYQRANSYLRPNANNSKILHVGGFSVGEFDWAAIKFRSAGDFTVNNNAIVNAGGGTWAGVHTWDGNHTWKDGKHITMGEGTGQSPELRLKGGSDGNYAYIRRNSGSVMRIANGSSISIDCTAGSNLDITGSGGTTRHTFTTGASPTYTCNGTISDSSGQVVSQGGGTWAGTHTWSGEMRFSERVRFVTSKYQISSDGRDRFYFYTNAGTIIKGGAGTDAANICEFRDTRNTANMVRIQGNGNLTAKGALITTKAQNNGLNMANSQIVCLPTATTNTTGYTSIALSSSVAANQGWTISALRYSTGAAAYLDFTGHSNSAAGSRVARFFQTGNAEFQGQVSAASFQATSAIRYKDIERVASQEESLKIIEHIGNNGVHIGKWNELSGKADRDTTHRWVIAENVDEVAPEAVIKNDDGECESVDYNAIIADLTAAVALLSKRVKELENG